MLSIALVVVCTSCVAPAFASDYNAELSGTGAYIGTTVHTTIPTDPEKGEEVIDNLIKSVTNAQDKTGNTYNVKSAEVNDDYYRGTITVGNKAGDDIANPGDTFNVDVAIPAGVTCCIKIEVTRGWIANNSIKLVISSEGYTTFSTPTLNNPGTLYYGLSSEGATTFKQETDLKNVIWFKTTAPVFVNVSGKMGALGSYNFGNDIFDILIKKG